MNKPPVASVIEGLNRRLHFIQFPCSFVDFPDPKIRTQKPQNINIVSELLEELPGIFNWAYDGYKLLNTVGYFTDTPEQSDITQRFEETSDPVSVFCAEHIFEEPMTRDAVYTVYKEWCENTGHKPMSRERFMPLFRDCMGDRIDSEYRQRVSGRVVRGFHFVPVTADSL
jgi:putative DNA primase/helicase